MKKFLLAFSILVAPILIVIGVASGANWIVTCSQSHLNNDDPIVFPNQPGASHTHLFAGSRGTDAFSTPDQMRAAGTTCLIPGDTAGYWEPKPNNYNLHPNGGLLVYYAASTNGRAFPDGLKMVVGNAKATSEATNWGIAQGRIRFKCGPGSGTETPRPPMSCSSGMLVPVVTFPKWWDGVNLDSPDHISHMSYSKNTAHPIELIQLKAYVRHAVPASQLIDFSLASGPYYTYHMDAFLTWQAADLQRLVEQCITTGRNCGTNPQ